MSMHSKILRCKESVCYQFRECQMSLNSLHNPIRKQVTETIEVLCDHHDIKEHIMCREVKSNDSNPFT